MRTCEFCDALGTLRDDGRILCDSHEDSEANASFALSQGSELRNVRAQLAAVEKERDKLKEENSRLWAEAGDSSAVQARKERDEATGALAAAMDEVAWLTTEVEALATNSPALVEIRDHGLRFLSSPAADLAARHDAAVRLEQETTDKHGMLLVLSSMGIATGLSRPAEASIAETMRLVYAEVERRALEKAAAHETFDELPLEWRVLVREKVRALATPTPEKP